MRSLALFLAFTLCPTLALAESAPPPPCVPGDMRPSGPNIPANLSSFTLMGDYLFVALPIVRLYERTGAGGVERPLDIVARPGVSNEWTLTPLEPLVAGATYVLVDESCSFSPTEWMYFVDPAVPVPATLGVTTVGQLYSFRDRPGVGLRYFVRVGLELSDEALAARALYEGSMLVDGAVLGVWGELETFDGRVYVRCDSESSFIEPGTREFSHQARLRGLDPSLFTEGVVRDLICDDAVRVHPIDEHVLSPMEIEEMDRIPDGGFVGLDAGLARDAGPGFGSDAGDGPGTSDGGCGCRASGRGASGSWLGFAIFCAVVVGRRLRRRA